MLKGLIFVLLTLACSRDQQAAEELAKIHDKVAEDAVAQFEIARRAGDPIQTCASAGLVTAAFLQSKNEAKFREWKEIERAACADAGLPSN